MGIEFKDWMHRRDRLGHQLCHTVMAAKGSVCGCFNGDEPPQCLEIRAAVDQALATLGCEPPLPTEQEVDLLRVLFEHYGFGLDRNDGRIKGRLGAWESCLRKEFVATKRDSRTGQTKAFLTWLGRDAMDRAIKARGVVA